MSASIGLDIGTRAVRAVQVSRGKRGAVLDKLAQVELPAGVVRDGEILAPEVVTAALQQLWKRGGFASRRVALGIANQQVIVRQVDLPFHDEAELRSSLPFQAQEHLPIPVDEAILDFHVIETAGEIGAQRTARVLLVAAQRAQVQSLLAVVQAAKLKPVGLDLEAFAALRALASPALPDDTGELIVHLGAAVTNLVVHVNGNPRFVRILPMGGDALIEALVTELGYSAAQAEQRAAVAQPPTEHGWLDVDDAARIISDRTTHLIDEIRGSTDYYAAQPGAVPLRGVVLSGGPSLLPDLDARLGGGLGLPVTHGRPLRHLTPGRTGLDDDEIARAQPFLPVAVGLALGAAA